MALTESALRRIIRSEISALLEGRSNTFMLSRMEEQDQDGDGDEDFDDVRVARFKASGMSKDKAVDKVKKKPLGKKTKYKK
jgi:Rad3-related DNA helicase